MAKKKKDDAQYQRVEVSIWNKKRFKGLSDDAKTLYLYIIINPHGNMTGLFYLPQGYALEDLNWSSEKRFTKGLGELLEEGLVGYDFDNKIILDKNQLIKFPLQNPNQVKGAISKLKELPFTKLFKDLAEIIKADGKPLYKPLLEWLDKRLGEYVDVDVDVDVNENKSINTFISASVDAVDDGVFFLTQKKRKLSGKRLETFNRFWEAFNLKKGKAEAADAWLDIPTLTDAMVEKIIDAAKKEAELRKNVIAQGKTPKWAQGWLSGRRWEDEEYSKPPEKDTRWEGL